MNILPLILTAMLSLLLSFSAHALAFSSVDLDIDNDACIDGWGAMDITVEVNDESFDLTADCDWDLSESIQTEKGMFCLVEAEMCLGDNDSGEVEVDCEDGSSESESFDCPVHD